MNSPEEKPVVHMKCKRGSDQATVGQSCPGMLAENLSVQGSHVAQFKCKKCQFIWSIPVGGYTPI